MLPVYPQLCSCAIIEYMKVFQQSLVIILSSLTVLAIVYTPFSPYIPLFLTFIAVLILSYALFKKKRKKGQEVFSGSNKEIYIILVSALLIVFYTGGIKSVVFFLVYFVLFGITFTFQPSMILLFLACLIGLFLPEALQDDVFGNMAKLSSLIVLAPIAFFFGREYRKREKLQEKIQEKTETIIHDAENLLATNDKNEKLKNAEEIIIEAKKLQKESNE